MKRFSKFLAIVLSIVILSVLGAWYLWDQKYYPATDDAYVQANVVNIAAQVTGPVLAIYVQDHATVKTGQPLFDIDPKPFIIAVNQAQADLENTRLQINAEADAVGSAQAILNERQAELVNAEKYAGRVNALVKQKLLSAADGDEVTSKFKVAQAAVIAAQTQLDEAKEKLGDPGAQNAQLQAAQAKLDQAKLNLQYTHVTAPTNGYIVNFTLRPGAMVSAQQSLFAIVDDSNWWVSANFKETDLARIRAGQKASIKVDMYPNYTFTGIVQSISSGSGAQFSLLPPENATGNWVKVTQRIPVRVNITNTNSSYPLRVGASSTVTINTHGNE